MPQPFKTERQRRWFFYALREGLITVPYTRTGLLANSWRTKREGWADWVIENSAIYGALVVGRGKQASYHQNHWWIAEDVIEKDTPDLTRRITKDLMDLTK